MNREIIRYTLYLYMKKMINEKTKYVDIYRTRKIGYQFRWIK